MTKSKSPTRTAPKPVEVLVCPDSGIERHTYLDKSKRYVRPGQHGHTTQPAKPVADLLAAKHANAANDPRRVAALTGKPGEAQRKELKKGKP